MKKAILYILIVIGSFQPVLSQSMNSIYFLSEWSQRHTLNAAFAPENGHFSLPLGGGVNFNISSNTGLSNFVYPYNNELVTFMHPSVDGHDFIDRLSPNIFLHQNMKVNLLSFGVATENAYWSFDYNLQEQLNINVPLDMFRLVKLGFEHQSNLYDLKDMSIDQLNIAEYSIGYSRKLNSKFRVGINVKLLIGLASEQIKYSVFDVSLANDRYEINASGESYIMSDILMLDSDTDNNIDFLHPDINFSSKNPAGTGGAIDIGLTYNPTSKLTISSAVNGLGFVRWDASKITKGIANSNFVFTGFSVIDNENNNIETQLNQMEQDLNNLILFERQPAATTGLTTITPTTINLSAEYSLFNNPDHDIKLGLLLNSYNSSTYTSNQIMSAVTFKAFSWLDISTSYSIFLNESNRFGIAMNFSPEWLNVFLAADFSTVKFNRQFIPINKFNLNLQAGISLYLGD